MMPCGYHVDLSEKCPHFLLASHTFSHLSIMGWHISRKASRVIVEPKSSSWYGMAMGPWSHSPAITRNAAAQRASMRHSTESWAYQQWEMMGLWNQTASRWLHQMEIAFCVHHMIFVLPFTNPFRCAKK